MQDTIKAAIKLFALLIWIGLFYPPVWLAARLRKEAYRKRMIRACDVGILRIIGIRLTVTGELSALRPLLLVTNHLSYLDMPILGSQDAMSFTPKSEIARWPIIGGIARVCDSVFIDRRPEKIENNKTSLQSALAADKLVCLFPEATTGDGLHQQPFKSGFFSLAEEPLAGRELLIQPAALTYTHISRLPIDMAQWPSIAWYGDMELAPHAWSLLKLGPIAAHLVFLPPVTLSQFGDRKKLALHCQETIAGTIENIRNQI